MAPVSANATAPAVEAQGARIPLVGLGTWDLRGSACARVVEQALRLGYRHIDTAEMYDNEREVGEGLHASGVRRGEVFVTTKIWPSHFAPRELERAARDCLVRLRLSEVDLLLLHWPNPQIPLAETLGALAKVKRDGLARHIGVSNFTVALIEQAVRETSAPLVCNQIECHPFLDQAKVIAACRRDELAVVAYSPIARGRAHDNKVLARIGAAHGKSAAQVLAALPGAAGHRRHSAHRQGRTADGERRDLRLHAERAGEGRDCRARAPRRPRRRQGVFRPAAMGLNARCGLRVPNAIAAD
jgi:2,5-diketo-D-gluconate reductase B